MSFDPAKPYNALPALPPKADIESRSILKACIEARASVAALKQACALIPNAGVLINSIPLLEAQASSEIENIVTTTDALFRYAQNYEQVADANTKEALHYRTALKQGVESLKTRPLCTATAVAVCTIQNLVESGLAHRETASKYLKDLAHIGVLEEVQAGREKLFIHPRFVQLLTADTHQFTLYDKPKQSGTNKTAAVQSALRRKK